MAKRANIPAPAITEAGIYDFGNDGAFMSQQKPRPRRLAAFAVGKQSERHFPQLPRR